MTDVGSLRDELRKRRQAVSQKIARTKRETGAIVSGTEFDPRRPAGVENRYNARQLQAHIAELNDFMRRGNQFVSGMKGTPIPRGEFLRYKRNEAEQNAAAAAHAASIGSLQTPLGLSVRELKSAVPQAQGSAVYGPYQRFERESTSIKDVGALRKLTSDMINKLKSGFLTQKIEGGKQNAYKALTVLGEHEEIEMISRLSDYQFDALWFGTTYAEGLFMRYGMAKSRNEEPTRKERWQDRAIEGAADDAREFLDWAFTEVPTNRPST